MRVIESPRKPVYPQRLLRDGVEGRVVFNFVVDTTGSADMTTIRDKWPDDRPRLEGTLAQYYKQLLTSARSSIRRARFAPARIGGCAVPQLVQQAFVWEFR